MSVLKKNGLYRKYTIQPDSNHSINLKTTHQHWGPVHTGKDIPANTH